MQNYDQKYGKHFVSAKKSFSNKTFHEIFDYSMLFSFTIWFTFEWMHCIKT